MHAVFLVQAYLSQRERGADKRFPCEGSVMPMERFNRTCTIMVHLGRVSRCPGSCHLSLLSEGAGKGPSAAREGHAGPKFTDEFRAGRPFPDPEKANR